MKTLVLVFILGLAVLGCQPEPEAAAPTAPAAGASEKDQKNSKAGTLAPNPDYKDQKPGGKL